MAKRSYPVKDIKPMARPDLVWIYEPETGRGPLHIADKECVHGLRGYHKPLTRCGRPIDPDHHAWEIKPEEFDSFRFCKRCGIRADFDKAFAEYQAWDKERTAETNAKRQAEATERERLHQERRERASRLYEALMISQRRPNATLENGVFRFKFEDRWFEVKEVD